MAFHDWTRNTGLDILRDSWQSSRCSGISPGPRFCQEFAAHVRNSPTHRHTRWRQPPRSAISALPNQPTRTVTPARSNSADYWWRTCCRDHPQARSPILHPSQPRSLASHCRHELQCGSFCQNRTTPHIRCRSRNSHSGLGHLPHASP